MIKSALAVYHWFVRQTPSVSRILARKPSGEEVAIEAAELAVLEGKGNRLTPEELGLLAKQLATASTPVFQHLLDRVQSRKIPASQLELLAKWLDSEPEVPETFWYKQFSAMTVSGEGELIKIFLLPGQAAKGQRIR